jgi:hypothetical protein
VRDGRLLLRSEGCGERMGNSRVCNGSCHVMIENDAVFENIYSIRFLLSYHHLACILV